MHLAHQDWKMFLYVASDDCKDIYPNNSCWDFTVELPEEVQGVCRVALTQVFFKQKSFARGLYFVICDICEESVVKGKRERILGTFFTPGSLDSPDYIGTSRDPIKRLRFSVKDIHFETPKDYSGALNFTLHLTCSSRVQKAVEC